VRVVGLAARAADLLESRQVVGEVGLVAVLVGDDVGAAARPAFLAGAVVGEDDEDRVVEPVDRLQVVDEAAELVVGVVDHRRERFLQRADDLRSSAESVSHGTTVSFLGASAVPSGMMPSSSWRPVARSRITSQPSS
jgi:hypothetical protein